MKSNRWFVIFLCAFSLTGCIKVDTGTRQPTMGSELIDLARAKEMGNLSEQEFREMKRKVLASF